MPRLTITTRLFLAVLAMTALVALVMGVAAQWSFHRGFIGFLNEQAAARLDVSVPRLQSAYAEHGDWEFLRGRNRLWFMLTRPDDDPTPMESHTRGPHPEPALDPTQPLGASELLGASRRMSLLDAQRQHVMGFRLQSAQSEEREIVVGGQVVGYLMLAPIQRFTDDAALRFVNSQLRASLGAGLLALALAALLAWWVARRLLAPVRQVAQATHRLSAGDYTVRVPVAGHDEVAQLGQDFNQLALTLGRNEQARRDFMADISHELRTPLAVLKGELEALEDGVHQPTPELLALLRGKVDLLGDLVGDLHTLALADVGALSYQRQDLDLVDLVRDEARTLALGCEARRLALQIDLPAAALPAQADAARLRQLLHNLFGNTVRHTDAGGQVRLSLRREDDAAVLDLQDSAPGVPEADLARLGERFFRVERSRTRQGAGSGGQGGSGLGLAIARSIAEAHGGHLLARAAPLGGLWMQLRLPLLRQTAVERGGETPGAPCGLGTGLGLGADPRPRPSPRPDPDRARPPTGGA
ncbi:MAG: putative signal transduction histidine-protein kinase BaeS [Pseudomonadota bacterium]